MRTDLPNLGVLLEFLKFSEEKIAYSALKNKTETISELDTMIYFLKEKMLLVEKALQLTEEENQLVTIKNQYLEEQLDILNKQQK